LHTRPEITGSIFFFDCISFFFFVDVYLCSLVIYLVIHLFINPLSLFFDLFFI
jgi:hypothetical protein